MNKVMLIRLAFIVFTLLLAILLFREMTINSCLDAGGIFNYATTNCETLPDVNYVPLLNRDVWYRIVLLAIFLPAVPMFLIYKVLIYFLPISQLNEQSKQSNNL